MKVTLDKAARKFKGKLVNMVFWKPSEGSISSGRD